MTTIDYIAIFAIILIVGGAVFYIVREKKKGVRCIGCPHAKECGGKCNCADSQGTANNNT